MMSGQATNVGHLANQAPTAFLTAPVHGGEVTCIHRASQSSALYETGLTRTLWFNLRDLGSVTPSQLAHASAGDVASLFRASLPSWATSARPAVQANVAVVSGSPLAQLVLDLDVAMVGAELFLAACLVGLCVVGAQPKESAGLAHRELTALCLRHNLSLTEVGCLVGAALGLVAFDLVVAVSEDDSLEVAGLALLLLTALASFLLASQSALGVFAGFSGLGGPALLRAVVADGLNLFLGFLRVGFCFVRYVFYDLQGEVVDFAFHGTDVEDVSLLGSLSEPALGLGIFLDLGFWVFQALLALVKLGLAFYLFWLMLDTFLLRPVAARETRRPR